MKATYLAEDMLVTDVGLSRHKTGIITFLGFAFE